MKITYYAQSDILFIEFNDGPVGASTNLGNWANITFTPEGAPHSLEIIHAAARGIEASTVSAQLVLNESVADTPTPLSPEALKAGRKARAEAIRAARKIEA
jgi:uncharacterized protein YuzE